MNIIFIASSGSLIFLFPIYPTFFYPPITQVGFFGCYPCDKALQLSIFSLEKSVFGAKIKLWI